MNKFVEGLTRKEPVRRIDLLLFGRIAHTLLCAHVSRRRRLWSYVAFGCWHLDNLKLLASFCLLCNWDRVAFELFALCCLPDCALMLPWFVLSFAASQFQASCRLWASCRLGGVGACCLWVCGLACLRVVALWFASSCCLASWRLSVICTIVSLGRLVFGLVLPSNCLRHDACRLAASCCF